MFTSLPKDMRMPKVSVIIPVYGVEKYIERCARSLFEQTLDDIEYLFIDDCTPDRSIEILQQVLEEYPQRKPQVVIHRMEKNSGQAAVRKWGMQNATGEYVIHCDSDDWADTDMYRAMYEKAKHENVDVVVCDYAVTNGSSEYTYYKACHSKSVKEFIENTMLLNDNWSLCNKLIRRKLINDIVYPKGSMGEDMAIVIQILWKCQSFVYIEKAFYKYFYNTNSITKKKTIETCLRSFYQVKDNLDLLISLHNPQMLSPKMKSGFLYMKYLAKSHLLHLVNNNFYYMLWRDTYKDMLMPFLLSTYIPMNLKIKYLLTLVHIYPRKKDRII